MPITAAHNISSNKVSAYIRNTLLALLGFGSAAGITGGYLNLRNEIKDLGNNNVQLARRLDDSEIARGSLLTGLSKANATIARLEEGVSANRSLVDGGMAEIERNKKALAGMSSEIGSQGTQIAGLVKRDKEHDDGIGKLDKGLGSVKVAVGKLESEVSVSELQDVYNQALTSTVILKMEVKYQEDHGDGNKIERTDLHRGSGVVVAHINNGTEGGYFITNWHVLSCGNLKEEDYKNIEITVILSDGSKVKAKPYYYKNESGQEILARRKEHDLILLKTTENISKTVPVSFASEAPRTGEAVIVIGNQFGEFLGETFSGAFGIVSGNNVIEYGEHSASIIKQGQETQVSDIVQAIRTDAAVYPGNSGGLGFRVRDGKMVFMPTFIFVRQEAFASLGFGTVAPTIRDDIKAWIPYDLNPNGSFVERQAKPAAAIAVSEEKIPSVNKR